MVLHGITMSIVPKCIICYDTNLVEIYDADTGL